jgi:hypothetical protein
MSGGDDLPIVGPRRSAAWISQKSQLNSSAHSGTLTAMVSVELSVPLIQALVHLAAAVCDAQTLVAGLTEHGDWGV